MSDDDGHEVASQSEGGVKLQEPSASGRVERGGDLRIPASSMHSILSSSYPGRSIVPMQENLCASVLDLSAIGSKAIAPVSKEIQAQVAPAIEGVLRFTSPPVDLSVIKQIAGGQTVILARLGSLIKQFFDPERLPGINWALLPSNLRGYADDISVKQVKEFLIQEGIPLYLVPRGRTALRLLRAQDRGARRRVLGECYTSIIDDCYAVLEQVDRAAVGDELEFVLDGLGAMCAGHFRSAQAMFTVTLDTLIYRLHQDQATRRLITNHKKGADVPEIIDEMDFRAAMVWLPIWNAHEQYWKGKGDKIPYHYSRHASVHGVSSRQFNKRNCVQVLMLITSLIGYADYRSVALTD